MDTTPTNSSFEMPNRVPEKIRQEPGKNYYRRRGFDSTDFSEDLAPNSQTFHRDSNLDRKQNSLAGEKDPETLDPQKQDEEILDPGREYRNREFPRKEDQDDINPNRNIPEEDNDLNDEDGAIIDEPAQEEGFDKDKIVPKEDTYYLTDEDGAIIDEPGSQDDLEENKIVPKEDTYFLISEEGDIIKEPSRD
ncbi:MAG TPA: hypothetical protein VLA71_09240 [Algoriphagus sp.]|nr:hypothetical protein [Algoriphagus sp.]